MRVRWGTDAYPPLPDPRKPEPTTRDPGSGTIDQSFRAHRAWRTAVSVTPPPMKKIPEVKPGRAVGHLPGQAVAVLVAEERGDVGKDDRLDSIP